METTRGEESVRRSRRRCIPNPRYLDEERDIYASTQEEEEEQEGEQEEEDPPHQIQGQNTLLPTPDRVVRGVQERWIEGAGSLSVNLSNTINSSMSEIYR